MIRNAREQNLDPPLGCNESDSADAAPVRCVDPRPPPRESRMGWSQRVAALRHSKSPNVQVSRQRKSKRASA
eukprot:scaffold26604_cov116-Isochrysis_galbana.AAC.7